MTPLYSKKFIQMGARFMQFLVLLENLVKNIVSKTVFLDFRSVLIQGFGELWGKSLDPVMIE